MSRYALAPNPIWWGIQGEGHLRVTGYLMSEDFAAFVISLTLVVLILWSLKR